MPLQGLECQLSKSVKSDTRPRPAAHRLRLQCQLQRLEPRLYAVRRKKSLAVPFSDEQQLKAQLVAERHD
jgi:hypothetical protein